jgi:hypothetical protein
METEESISGLNKTRDRSKLANHATLGNGTGSNQPTFLDPGYDFTGSDYQQIPAELWNQPKEMSIVFALRPYWRLASGTHKYMMSPDTFFEAIRFDISDKLVVTYNGLSFGANYTEIVPFWREGDVNVIGLCATEAGLDGSARTFVNGSVVKSAISGYTPTTPPNPISIGRRSDGALAANGRYVHVSFYDKALVPIQMIDLAHFVMTKYGSKV